MYKLRSIFDRNIDDDKYSPVTHKLNDRNRFKYSRRCSHVAPTNDYNSYLTNYDIEHPVDDFNAMLGIDDSEYSNVGDEYDMYDGYVSLPDTLYIDDFDEIRD